MDALDLPTDFSNFHAIKSLKCSFGLKKHLWKSSVFDVMERTWFKNTQQLQVMEMMAVPPFPKEFCLYSNNPWVCSVFLTQALKGCDWRGVLIPHLEMGKAKQLLGEVCLMLLLKNNL